MATIAPECTVSDYSCMRQTRHKDGFDYCLCLGGAGTHTLPLFAALHAFIHMDFGVSSVYCLFIGHLNI